MVTIILGKMSRDSTFVMMYTRATCSHYRRGLHSVSRTMVMAVPQRRSYACIRERSPPRRSLTKGCGTYVMLYTLTDFTFSSERV